MHYAVILLHASPEALDWDSLPSRELVMQNKSSHLKKTGRYIINMAGITPPNCMVGALRG